MRGFADAGGRSCHQPIPANHPLEPMPVKGKNGTVDLKFQAAYDAKNAYFRYQWKTQNPYPGSEYQYQRFDGKEWKTYGYPKLDKVVQEGKQPAIYEDRMTIMIDDGKVPMFAQQGCWLTCHEGERDMPKQFTKEGKAPVKFSDFRKVMESQDVDVVITGTGFDRGSVAEWAIDGVPSGKVVVNATRYVSSKELVATVTIALDAGKVAKLPGFGAKMVEICLDE